MNWRRGQEVMNRLGSLLRRTVKGSRCVYDASCAHNFRKPSHQGAWWTLKVFLAQLVEQLTLNQWVEGSSPSEDTPGVLNGTPFSLLLEALLTFFLFFLSKLLHNSKKSIIFAAAKVLLFV